MHSATRGLFAGGTHEPVHTYATNGGTITIHGDGFHMFTGTQGQDVLLPKHSVTGTMIHIINRTDRSVIAVDTEMGVHAILQDSQAKFGFSGSGWIFIP